MPEVMEVLRKCAASKRVLNECVGQTWVAIELELGNTPLGVKAVLMDAGFSAEEADFHINRWLYSEET